MWIDRESVMVWAALLVQLLGVIGVLGARLSQRRGASRWTVGIAVACMIAVGIVSLGTMETCERGWLVFATTLPLMAVGATLDMRKSGARVAF